jgi:D-glycero-beta-D-manno-heptose 1-phosphate adenylyltransferase
MTKLNIAYSKIISPQNITGLISQYKQNNEKIIFTNGCFDVLHYGHIDYLSKAADFGSKLIIGLNSDDSVKQLKGDSRPINNENARAMILASLFFVDAIIIFDENTPEKLIKSVYPDVLVKGGDYKLENIVGADFVISNGGKVEIIPFVEGFSSTNIINLIGNE